MKSSGQDRERRRNNPWEVLVVASLFFFPGAVMLFQRGTLVAFQQSFKYLPSGFMVLSEHDAHIFGMLAMPNGAETVILDASLPDEILTTGEELKPISPKRFDTSRSTSNHT
jgi:hypothetical protein